MSFDPITHIFSQLDTLREDLSTLHELTGKINREIGEVQTELAGRRELIEADQRAMRRLSREVDRLRRLIGGSGPKATHFTASPLHQILMSAAALLGSLALLWLIVSGQSEQAVALVERIPR